MASGMQTKALGLPYTKTMYQIIIPQAFRIAIPSLGNVAMDLVKGTSLVAMITVPKSSKSEDYWRA